MGRRAIWRHAIAGGAVYTRSGATPGGVHVKPVRIGFIGLGNVGGKLAGNLLRHGVDLTVRDLNPELVSAFVARGANGADSPRSMAGAVDIVITCLPSPAASRAVMEAPDGVLAGLDARQDLARDEHDRPGRDRAARRAGSRPRGGLAMDCPVSGGCHRAATGNISIFAGGTRAAFERVLPVLKILGPADPAHRPARLGLGAQGGHQLPVHRAPGRARRGADGRARWPAWT